MGKHGHPDPETRFWSKVKLMPDGCLLWAGANHWNGTGQFSMRSMSSTAHRWAWYFAYGYMPDDEVKLAHTCENNWCVNVDHLEEMVPSDSRKKISERGEANA